MNTTTTLAKCYEPCWTHHPRGGKTSGYAGKIQRGLYGPERGIALTEGDARNGIFYTHAPASQVLKDETSEKYSNYLPLVNLKTEIKYVFSGSYTTTHDGTIMVADEPHQRWQNFPS